MYIRGDGVTQDYKAAVKWFTLAAEQRFAPAQNALGYMYRKGQGVTQDYKTAIKWFTLAAKRRDIIDQHNPTLWPYNRACFTRENAIAQCNLGSMNENGEGVIQDYKAARAWYILAAERENAEAQHSLGMMYAEGLGVIQNYTRAHMWWSIAASQGGEEASSNRDIIAEKMTPADISKAQELARECVAKNY
jgi:TPR repeat protein